MADVAANVHCGQAVATGYPLGVQLAAVGVEVDGGEFFASVEGVFRNTAGGGRHGDGSQAEATAEGTLAHVLGYGDVGEFRTTGKYSRADLIDRCREVKLFERSAVAEGIVAYALQAVGHQHLGGAGAAVEGIVANPAGAAAHYVAALGLVHHLGQVDVGIAYVVFFGQAGAPLEGLASYFSHAGGDVDGLQLGAIFENMFTDGGEAVGDGDLFQRDAIFESIFVDSLQAVGQGNGGETAATREGITSYRLQAVGQGNGGETAASKEGIHANVPHRAGEIDRCQAAAVHESIFPYAVQRSQYIDLGKAGAIFKSAVTEIGH